MSTRYVVATRASRCDSCGSRIHINDLITPTNDGEWIHAQCRDHEAQPDPEPCPTCWLTRCDCKDETP